CPWAIRAPAAVLDSVTPRHQVLAEFLMTHPVEAAGGAAGPETLGGCVVGAAVRWGSVDEPSPAEEAGPGDAFPSGAAVTVGELCWPGAGFPLDEGSGVNVSRVLAEGPGTAACVCPTWLPSSAAVSPCPGAAGPDPSIAIATQAPAPASTAAATAARARRRRRLTRDWFPDAPGGSGACVGSDSRNCRAAPVVASCSAADWCGTCCSGACCSAPAAARTTVGDVSAADLAGSVFPRGAVP